MGAAVLTAMVTLGASMGCGSETPEATAEATAEAAPTVPGAPMSQQTTPAETEAGRMTAPRPETPLPPVGTTQPEGEMDCLANRGQLEDSTLRKLLDGELPSLRAREFMDCLTDTTIARMVLTDNMRRSVEMSDATETCMATPESGALYRGAYGMNELTEPQLLYEREFLILTTVLLTAAKCMTDDEWQLMQMTEDERLLLTCMGKTEAGDDIIEGMTPLSKDSLDLLDASSARCMKELGIPPEPTGPEPTGPEPTGPDKRE